MIVWNDYEADHRCGDASLSPPGGQLVGEEDRTAFVDFIAANRKRADIIPTPAAFTRCDGADRAPASVAACV